MPELHIWAFVGSSIHRAYKEELVNEFTPHFGKTGYYPFAMYKLCILPFSITQ